MNFNQTILERVIDEARMKAAPNARCYAALNRAVIELEQNPHLDWQPETETLLILSPSNQIYEACAKPAGVCQCSAWKFQQVCWHRALARLIKRYHEAAARTVLVAAAGTPLPDGVLVRRQPKSKTLDGWTI